MFAKRDWSALVKKDAHSSGFERAGSMLEHGTDLRERDAREPGNKVRDLSTVFEVLEQGRNRNASAAKNPSATHALGVTLYSRAGRPVNHAVIVDPG